MESIKRFWPWVRDLGLIIIGSLAQAVGLRLFLIPADLASGGVSGIAQLINNFTNWPIGLMVFIGNVPLFVIGWRFLGGRKFGLRTAFAIITFSVAVDVLAYFLPGIISVQTPGFIPIFRTRASCLGSHLGTRPGWNLSRLFWMPSRPASIWK